MYHWTFHKEHMEYGIFSSTQEIVLSHHDRLFAAPTFRQLSHNIASLPLDIQSPYNLD